MMDFSVRVAQQNEAFHNRRVISAFSPDIDNADTPNIDIHPNPVKGLYPFQTADVALEVLSSSAADTSAGTGARSVRLTLLNSSFLEVTVDVTLNGTTPVAVSGGTIYRRVNKIQLLSWGSGATNAGNLTVRVSGGGAWQRYMVAGEATDRVGIYTVPANKYGILLGSSFSIERTTVEVMRVNILARIANPESPWLIEREHVCLSSHPDEHTVNLMANRLIGPLDIRCNAPFTSASNQRCVGRIFMIEETI